MADIKKNVRKIKKLHFKDDEIRLGRDRQCSALQNGRGLQQGRYAPWNDKPA